MPVRGEGRGNVHKANAQADLGPAAGGSHGQERGELRQWWRSWG